MGEIRVAVEYQDSTGATRTTEFVPVEPGYAGDVPLPAIPDHAKKDIVSAKVDCVEVGEDYEIKLVLSKEPEIRIAVQIGDVTPAANDFMNGAGSHRWMLPGAMAVNPRVNFRSIAGENTLILKL